MSTIPQPHNSNEVPASAPVLYASAYFSVVAVDHDPALLDASYSLRYQVYCLERQFLPREEYPDERERDEYDPHSAHLAVINTSGEIVATARLIEVTDRGLPLLDHCQLFPDTDRAVHFGARVVEVSRLCVSRRYNRRAGDAHYALAGARRNVPGPERRANARGGEIIMHVTRGLYVASKQAGYTHWLAATEQSLQRLISAYSLPFVPIGPETDYYGKVTPYSMSIAEFDTIIRSGTVPLVSDFMGGLTPDGAAVDASPLEGDIAAGRQLDERPADG
jgi:N-acyl amino acid synthase of PEP-CTERM/exosortase system